MFDLRFSGLFSAIHYQEFDFIPDIMNIVHYETLNILIFSSRNIECIGHRLEKIKLVLCYFFSQGNEVHQLYENIHFLMLVQLFIYLLAYCQDPHGIKRNTFPVPDAAFCNAFRVIYSQVFLEHFHIPGYQLIIQVSRKEYLYNILSPACYNSFIVNITYQCKKLYQRVQNGFTHIVC